MTSQQLLSRIITAHNSGHSTEALKAAYLDALGYEEDDVITYDESRQVGAWARPVANAVSLVAMGIGLWYLIFIMYTGA